jgi:hypothetical protein
MPEPSGRLCADHGTLPGMTVAAIPLTERRHVDLGRVSSMVCMPVA